MWWQIFAFFLSQCGTHFYFFLKSIAIFIYSRLAKERMVTHRKGGGMRKNIRYWKEIMLETNVSERYRRTWEGEVRREKLKRKCVMRIVFVYAVHLVNGRCGLVRLKDMIARSLLSDSGGGGRYIFRIRTVATHEWYWTDCLAVSMEECHFAIKWCRKMTCTLIPWNGWFSYIFFQPSNSRNDDWYSEKVSETFSFRHPIHREYVIYILNLHVR